MHFKLFHLLFCATCVIAEVIFNSKSGNGCAFSLKLFYQVSVKLDLQFWEVVCLVVFHEAHKSYLCPLHCGLCQLLTCSVFVAIKMCKNINFVYLLKFSLEFTFTSLASSMTNWVYMTLLTNWINLYSYFSILTW